MPAAPLLVQVDVTFVLHQGQRLIYFGGCDYLRLSWHPAIRSALASGSTQFGASVAASRLTTGNLPLYGDLERQLAAFFRLPTVTLTSSGYLATLAAAQALAEDHTTVLLDERSHACLLDAARLTGLPCRRFAYRDPAALAKAVARLKNHKVLVMTDGLFAHQGELAPLAEYLECLPQSATLLVDDAHGVGVLGEHGRGTLETVRRRDSRLVLTATLSKAFGCYGGMVLGSAPLQERLRERSRVLAGNTPVPPLCAVAAMTAIEVMRREGPDRRARLAGYVEQLKAAVRNAGWPIPMAPGPMFSLAPSEPAAIRRLKRMLLESGIYPSHIRYPNGPAPSYFRFAISSEHTPEQVNRLTEVLTAFCRTVKAQ